MLVVDNVTKYYGDFLAVSNLNFSLKEGESLGLLGTNGAGKSTTIKMIIGLIEPTHGSVKINGVPMTLDNIKLKHLIGYMPEESSLYEDMDAVSFLRFFSDIYNLNRQESDEKIRALLSDLKLDNKLISSMSKGMKRKLLIARSLLADPKILVYDEPASGIDPETTAFILDYISNLKKKGKIILMTGHNLNHVEKVVDKVIILKRGQKVFHDTIYHIKGRKSYSLRYLENDKMQEKNFSDIKDVNRWLHKLTSEGKQIIDFRQVEPSLEDIFLDIVRDPKR